jgi:hypothetical protein
MNARFADAGQHTGGLDGGTGNAWAGRWDPNLQQSRGPITVTVWVAGPNYVTAQAQVVVAAGP